MSRMIKVIANLWGRSKVRWSVGIMIGAVSLYLALRNLSWQDVWAAFRRADWGYVGLALLSVAAGVYAKARRWRVLLGKNEGKVNFSKLVMSHLAGQSLNLLYPARVGDISRVYIIGALGISRMFILGTVILEKLWDMFSYVLVFFLLLFMIPLPSWMGNSAYGMVTVTLLFFFASFLVSYRRKWLILLGEKLAQWLPYHIRNRLLDRMHLGLSSLDVLQSSKELFWLVFWTTLVWVLGVLNNYLVLMAFRMRLPVAASVLLLVALQAGISLPTAPGRLGIFQYICILVLGMYGIDQALAFSYSVLLHCVALFPIMLSGLMCAIILGVKETNITAPNLEAV